jgi:hypothetical protein
MGSCMSLSPCKVCLQYFYNLFLSLCKVWMNDATYPDEVEERTAARSCRTRGELLAERRPDLETSGPSSCRRTWPTGSGVARRRIATWARTGAAGRRCRPPSTWAWTTFALIRVHLLNESRINYKTLFIVSYVGYSSTFNLYFTLVKRK